MSTEPLTAFSENPPDDGTPFGELRWRDKDELISEWNFIHLGDPESWNRMFYLPEPEYDGTSQGFRFVLLEGIAQPSEDHHRHKDDFFGGKLGMVEVTCYGEAFFDGIRHLWMPYVHYADPRMLAQFFVELEKLEKRYCPES